MDTPASDRFPRPATLIAGFALVKLALHVATSSGYGYFRDELYYLACADHLAAGYVDHPPLCVFLLWLVHHTIGDSRLALRLLPALAGAGTVALVGAMARSLGGSTWALLLSMTAALVAPEYLALNHFYSMNAFDIFFWALTAYLLIRLIDEGDAARERRWWVWLGVALGFGLLNKISVLWVGAGLFVGLIATPMRRRLATPGPWIAGVIAAVIFAPYVVWEVLNAWPTLEFMQNASSEKMVAVSPLAFLAGQINMMLPFSAPLWLAGLAYLFLDSSGKRYRLLGWIYVTTFLILLLNGTSRAAYLAPAYTWLFAAGGVAFESWLRRPRLVTWLRPAMLVVLLVFGVLIAPLALPLLPIDTYIRYARAWGQAPETEERHEMGELGQFYADMHGWDAMVANVADVYRRLSPEDAAAARIFAPDYGVAGAIDFFGRAQGLPRAMSGHNNYWLWGPQGWDGRVLIMIGGREDRLRASFTEVERAGTIDCGRCMPYENGRPIWILRGLRRPLADFWTRIKHYD